MSARGGVGRIGLAGLDRVVGPHVGVGQQQLIEIAAGLSRSCQVLI
jgi:hypothetical protein